MNSRLFRQYLKNQEYRKLALNFTNFGVFQVINYIIPLVVIPYIVRVIGAEKFGIISFAQAICYYLLIVVEYGFTITGVQLIAQNRNSVAKQSEIFSAIIFIQIILMLLGLALILLAALVFQEVRQYFLVYLYSFLLIPGQIMIALWFFIGREEMQYLNYVNLIARLSYVALVFLVVRHEVDYVRIPLLNGISYIIAGFFSLSFILHKFKVRFQPVSIRQLYFYLKDGWHLFISNFAINLYRNSNVVLLGLVASKEVVGIYSAGEKVVKVFQSVFTPITQTLYPYFSRMKTTYPDKSLRSIKMLLKVMLVFSGIITLFLILLAKPLTIIILGKNFIAAQKIIAITAAVVMLGVLNYILGIIFMTNFNLKREFSRSVIITGVFNIIICLLLAYFYQAVGAAIAFTTAELLLFILLVFYIIRNKQKWMQTNDSC